MEADWHEGHQGSEREEQMCCRWHDVASEHAGIPPDVDERPLHTSYEA